MVVALAAIKLVSFGAAAPKVIACLTENRIVTFLAKDNVVIGAGFYRVIAACREDNIGFGIVGDVIGKV